MALDIMRQTLFMGDFNMNKKRLAVNIVSIVMIVLLTFLFFISFTPMSYMVRPVEVERRNVSGLYAEEQNTLDMIYVGGSAAFVYWQPLRAYNDYGYTSYNFGVNTMTPQSIKYFIKEAQKTQSPKLWVIDARPFQYGEDVLHSEIPIRNTVDSLNYSENRNDLIKDSVINPLDRWLYYKDFFKYKNRIVNVAAEVLMGDRTALNFMDNVHGNDLKGFYFVPKTAALQFVDYSAITEEVKIDEEVNDIYIDLLEYCKEQNLRVLFVVHSYIQQESHKKEYNYMRRVANEYGFDFLNTNDYYNEINLDYSYELYNNDHVNCFGAEKYTDFLAKYINDKVVKLPDHRGDEKYAAWDNLYANFVAKSNDIKTQIINLKNA